MQSSPNGTQRPLDSGHSRVASQPAAGFHTKLSSAGLVYKHFGREIVAGLMGKPATDAAVETVYLAVYRQFMEAIDAIDNGASRRG